MDKLIIIDKKCIQDKKGYLVLWEDERDIFPDGLRVVALINGYLCRIDMSITADTCFDCLEQQIPSLKHPRSCKKCGRC